MFPVFHLILLSTLFAVIYFINGQFKSLRNKNMNSRELNHRLSSRIKEKERLLEKVKTKRENIFRLVECAIVNERTRIAHELQHDTVQRLTAMRFRLERLNWYPLRPEVEKEINLLGDELNQIIRETRHLINGEVQASFSKATLTQLLKNLIQKFEPIFFLKIFYKVYHEEREFTIPPDIKKELYHLTQEAIQNAMKHSAGTELMVEVFWGERLVINVIDNGIGFLGGERKGRGSETMKESARKIGAVVQNVRRINGAQVQISLPNQYVTMPVNGNL